MFIRLVIKGKPDEEAVLCTNTQTYAVRLAMSSNTLLLVPPPPDKAREGIEDVLTAVASVSSHYELTKIAPRLHTLVSMAIFITLFHTFDDSRKKY
jgi:sister chromatid cohesion protein DCC1